MGSSIVANNIAVWDSDGARRLCAVLLGQPEPKNQREVCSEAEVNLLMVSYDDIIPEPMAIRLSNEGFTSVPEFLTKPRAQP